jgi:hypothetical protein
MGYNESASEVREFKGEVMMRELDYGLFQPGEESIDVYYFRGVAPHEIDSKVPIGFF